MRATAACGMARQCRQCRQWLGEPHDGVGHTVWPLHTHRTQQAGPPTACGSARAALPRTSIAVAPSLCRLPSHPDCQRTLSGLHDASGRSGRQWPGQRGWGRDYSPIRPAPWQQMEPQVSSRLPPTCPARQSTSLALPTLPARPTRRHNELGAALAPGRARSWQPPRRRRRSRSSSGCTCTSRCLSSGQHPGTLHLPPQQACQEMMQACRCVPAAAFAWALRPL